MFIVGLVVGILLIGATPLQGGISEQFNLFTRCQPVGINMAFSNDLIERQDYQSRLFPILKNMSTEIEIYLKNMGLYSEKSDAPYVLVLKMWHWYGAQTPVSLVQLKFEKALYDGATDKWDWAQTWETGRYWVGDPGENYSVLGLVRTFVQHYMAVNELACNKS